MLKILERFAHIEEMNATIYAQREAHELEYLEEAGEFKIGDFVTPKTHSRDLFKDHVYTVVQVYKRDGQLRVEAMGGERYMGCHMRSLVPQLWEYYIPETPKK